MNATALYILIYNLCLQEISSGTYSFLVQCAMRSRGIQSEGGFDLPNHHLRLSAESLKQM